MSATVEKGSRHHEGVAAIEFALIFPILLLMIYGLVTFGAALYTQLTVSRAVHDGARAVSFLPLGVDTPGYVELIKSEVIESLAASPIAPGGHNTDLSSRRAWLLANVLSRVSVIEGACLPGAGGSETCITIVLDFPYDDDGVRLLPSITIPMIGGTESWMPDVLSSRAVVQI